MNCFLAFAATAMLVVAVSAGTPCSDLCSGDCGLAKQGCNLLGLLDPMCETEFQMCSTGCATICGCIDSCSEKCGSALTTCKGTDNIFAIVPCNLQYAICQGVCNLQCAAQTASGAVSKILQGVSGAGKRSALEIFGEVNVD